MCDILNDLNEAQREAVTSTEGYVRVIAGAGSGKTRALSHRFAYLVNEIGILPGNILCVTFTNKAANEMRQRIHSLTGDNDTGYVNTFHGFCVSILQEDSYVVQYPKNFLVLDNSDIDAMLKIIYEERGLTLRDMTFGKARDMIEMRKLFKEPMYYEDMINMSLDVLKEKYDAAEAADDIIFYGYLYQEKKCFGLDYNDLLKFALYIFGINEEVKHKWQKRLEYIMIDEFQDIDLIQYQLMCVLCEYHKNLFIVGDPDQTIYSWRGADYRYLLEFERNFIGTKTIMMMENYRSTPEILSVANSLVDKNNLRIKKELLPTLEHGKPVVCHHAKTATQEAEWIADKIEEMLQEGKRYGNITVLYRAHYVTRTLEEVFLSREIPYNIYSGVQFFSRMEIKDALSYLRMVAYKDDLSFMRVVNVPKRNIGMRRMKMLQDYADEHQCGLYQALKENVEDDNFKGTGGKKFIELIESFSAVYEEKPISELFSELMFKSEYEKMLRTEGSQERLDNLAELKQSIYEYETTCGEETTLESYLSHIALFTNTDTVDSSDKVKMMTVHAAKGLEFPYVFLCGMNEGVFPSRKVKTLEGMEEERRLAFVAVTRAKRRLYLTESEGKNFDGTYRYPSRFIFDIGKEQLEFTSKPDEKLISEAKEYISLRGRLMQKTAEMKLFEKGDRVRHKVFGEGTIEEIDMDQQAYIIRFDSVETNRTIAIRVKLEKV